MVELEAPNLHELDLDRVIAYGHTWSPTIELTPKIPLYHGHAVNIDMALSATIEGQLLKMLVSLTKSQRVLEVGMFTGYSALAIAEALPDDGYVVACEVDDYVSQFAINCFAASPCGEKIKVKVAPAIETMQQLAQDGESFDLVFIDADKAGYIDYFCLLLDTELLAPDGFICVDNTLLQGEPYLPEAQRSANGQAIAHFNRFVAEDPRVEQVLIPLRDRVTIIKRKNTNIE